MRIAKIVVLAGFCVLAGKSFSQESNYQVRISAPVTWNISKAAYDYRDLPRFPYGQAFSYGANVTYLQTLFNSVYAIAGAGYMKQSFGIRRPVDVRSPYDIIYFTRNYHYHCRHIILGLGYKVPLSSNTSFLSEIAYNWFRSYQQDYYTYLNRSQTNYNVFKLGPYVTISVGAEHRFMRRLHYGASVQLIVDPRWNQRDDMFFFYRYRPDSQNVATTIRSFGLNTSLKYDFGRIPKKP